MHVLCMIKARIRWCTCRVENILTLGKLLSLWFCVLLHSILFLISQTSYHTYKIISSYELACPVMGTIFLVYKCMYVFNCLWENNTKKLYAKMRGRNYVVQTRACSKISFESLKRSADYRFRLEFLIQPSSGQLKTTWPMTSVLFISTIR